MENQELNDFVWDESDEGIVKDETIQEENVKTEEKGEKEEKFVWEEENEDTQNSEYQNEDEDDKKFKPILEEFKKLIPEDFEDEEDPEEIVKKTINSAVKNQIESMFKDLPDVVSNFNKFVIEGGEPKDFLKSLETVDLSLDLKLEDESEQENVLRNLMKKKGYDEEDIEMEIQLKKDSGLLEKFSKKEYNLWKKREEEKLKQIVEKQREKKQKDILSIKDKKKNINNFIKSYDKINLKEEDKKTLASYIYDAKEEVGDRVLTKLESDLLEFLNDDEKKIELALFLKNGIEGISKKLKNKVVDKIRDNVKSKKSMSSKTNIKEDLIPLWEKF